jgi:hypothetical protein
MTAGSDLESGAVEYYVDHDQVRGWRVRNGVDMTDIR